MKCYIKDFKTFRTVSHYDVLDYTLADGDSGSVKMFAENAVQMMTSFVGKWLVIENTLFYITGCSPEQGILNLTIEYPSASFSRPLPYNGQTTFGSLIWNGVLYGYRLGGGDDAYKCAYMNLPTNNDTTSYTPSLDDAGYYSLKAVMEDARKSGVDVIFEIVKSTDSTGAIVDALATTIQPSTAGTATIVFGDGHSTLEGESYEDNAVAKCTVVQKTDEATTTYDYYLSADHHISTTPPAERAVGKWNVYSCGGDQSPLAVATGGFGGNSKSHKIEFYSDRKLNLYQSINIRLRGEVFSTAISARYEYMNTSRYFYKCGDLATTLTEKINSFETTSSSSSGGGGGGEVTSVNGQIGDVVLDADAVGARPDDWTPTAEDIGAVSKTGLSNVLLRATSVQFTGGWTTISNVLSADIKKYAIAVIFGYFGNTTVDYRYAFQCLIVPTASSTAVVSFTNYTQQKGTLVFNLSSTNPMFLIYKDDGTLQTSGNAQLYQIQGILPLS